MLIFSVLCLLNASSLEPFQEKDVKLVSGHIYSVTKPPHQIAAFADGTPNALLYANRLKDKKNTSAVTRINAVIDSRFYVEKAHQTEGGWIVYHSDNAHQAGKKFESYIVSAAASWEILRATISSTLTNFMKDYTIAFHPATQVVEKLLQLRQQSPEKVMEKGLNLPQVCPRFEENETGMKQALSCYASLQIARDKIEKELEHEISEYAKSKGIKEEMVSRLNQIICIPENMKETAKHQAEKERLMKGQPQLGAEAIQEQQILDFRDGGKNITHLKKTLNSLTCSSFFQELEAEMKRIWHSLLDAKAKQTGGLVFDAVNGKEFKEKCLQDKWNLEEELLAYLKSKAMFFKFQGNGLWISADGNTNNCMFASISQTAGAVEKLIQQFIPNETARKKLDNKTWSESWAEGGKLLRHNVLKAFSEETDIDRLSALCSKESAVYAQRIRVLQEQGRADERQALLKEFQQQIVSKYQSTSEFLPLWIHDYIGQSVPGGLKIFCFIQPDDKKDVLVSQAEVNLKGMTSDSVFVLNQLGTSDRSALAARLMPETAGYHYDGLAYVKTGW